MPSRNSVNKPKHIGRKKPNHKRGISKKGTTRTEKKERKLRLEQQLLQQADTTKDGEMEIDTSKRQQKKAQRQRLLIAAKQNSEPKAIPSGNGTTLGGPEYHG